MRLRDLTIISAYIALSLILTYPLALNFSTHVPGSEMWAFDEYSFVWSQWWVKHALFDLGTNPLVTRFVFYPLGLSLASFTMLWTNVIVGLPIYFAFGVVPATNATVLLSFVLGGSGAYWLAKYLLQVARFQGFSVTFNDKPTSKHWNGETLELAAFTAGIVFAFSSSRLVYAALGHYTVLATQWFPFYILFLIKTTRAPGWKNPLLAALFAGLALYSDAAHAPLLALFTLLYLAFERRAALKRAVIARLAILVAATMLFFAPLLVPLVNEILLSGYQLPGWGHAEKLLVDLMGLLTPTSLHPLNRNWTQELDLVRQGISRFVDVNTVFLGYATLALAIVGAWIFRKRLAVWIASAITFGIFSLGPLLHIGGQSVFDFDGLPVTVPMPYLLLHYIPFLKENRVPNRYSILVTLALAVLVAFAVAWASQWTRQKAKAKNQKWSLLLPFAFILLASFEHLSIPLPLTDARVPDVYRIIAQEPGEFAILSLPLGWRNSFTTLGAEDTRTQYYQSAHGKYLLSGNTSRNPPALFEYFDRISLLRSFAEIELYRDVPPETRARDQRDAPKIAAFYDIRYLVVNAAVPNRLPYSDTRPATLDYALQILPLGDKIYDREGIVAYRLKQASIPAVQRIEFGSTDALLYQIEGWGRVATIAQEPASWVEQKKARIMFPARVVSGHALTIRALPYVYAGAPAQTIEIAVNGQTVGNLALQNAWADYSVALPARVLRAGLNEISLSFAYAARPRDVEPPVFEIARTGVTTPMDIVASGGATGSIQVNGRQVSRQTKGYNVVVIDPRLGKVTAAQSFNTADSRDDSRALTAYIEKIPNGHIVALASQEGAAVNLGDRAAQAFQSLGGSADPRQQLSFSYALIGVKGAQPGAAIESFKPGAAIAWVGRNPDERTLAAAVSMMIIERQ